jgi:hypothetical protein
MYKMHKEKTKDVAVDLIYFQLPDHMCGIPPLLQMNQHQTRSSVDVAHVDDEIPERGAEDESPSDTKQDTKNRARGRAMN